MNTESPASLASHFVDFQKYHNNSNVICRSVEEMIAIETEAFKAGVKSIFLGRSTEGIVQSSYYLQPIFATDADGPNGENLWAHRGWLSYGKTGFFSDIQQSLDEYPQLNFFAVTTEEVAKFAKERTEFTGSSYDEIVEIFGDFLEPYTLGSPEAKSMQEHYRKKILLLRKST